MAARTPVSVSAARVAATSAGMASFGVTSVTARTPMACAAATKAGVAASSHAT